MAPTASGTTNRGTRFLTLPVRIRLHIYHQLLVSKDGLSPSPVFVGTWIQIYHFLKRTVAETGTIHPDILLTCKKIYDEANPILYAENSFMVMDPDKMLHFTEPMGSINFSYLRTIQIALFGFPTKDKIAEWVGLFAKLAKYATGLRVIVIDYARRRGWGENIEFLHAFAEIKGLEYLELRGFYAQHWPAYLEKHMLVVPTISYVNGGGVSEASMASLLEEYQKTTTDLIPRESPPK